MFSKEEDDEENTANLRQPFSLYFVHRVMFHVIMCLQLLFYIFSTLTSLEDIMN